MNRDERQSITLQSYNQHIREYVGKVSADTERTEAYWPGVQSFLGLLKSDEIIFEIGSGSGRDARGIEQAGFTLIRSDASSAFLDYLRAQGFAAEEYDVLKAPTSEKWHAIFANAVFLHFTREQFRMALGNVHKSLRDDGLFCIGMKLGDFEGWREKGLSGKRYFKFWKLPDLMRELKAGGFDILSNYVTEEQDFAALTCRRSSMKPLSASDDVDHLAKVIWDYHNVHHALHKADAILVLGSLDTRVAERGAQLFLDGYGEHLIFSGGVGALTKGKFAKSEAGHFADIAISMGVPKGSILLEPDSTNTGENIRFSYELMQAKAIPLHSIIVVQKPYMERRTFATFRKQWPDPTTELMVTSPEISYEDYPNAENPKDLVINIMAGDLQRIKEYPKLGFQVEQDIPKKVWSAYERLVALGYTSHLLKP